MPVSPEALLISSILKMKDYELALKASVTAEMFHAYQDEWVWIERYWLRHRRQPTPVAFKAAFPEFRIYRADDTDHFIERVRESHARFMLTNVMRDCTEMIASGDIDRAVAFMTGSMNTVAATMGATSDMDLINDWERTYEDATYRKERFEEFGMAGIPTGFETLDDRTGGVQPGQTWIVAARLGEKKSWTLTRMATAALIAGFNVHYTALEQSSIEVSMRAHNFLSGAIGRQVFESQALMMGKTPDMSAYRAFLRDLKGQIKSRMTISDKRGIGAPEFRAQLERHKPDIWYLDYMTLANTGGSGDWQDIGKLSKTVNELAGEYKVGVVAAAQLNRNAAQGREPAGADTLAQSDQIGQDAHLVVTTKQLSGSVNVFQVQKNRHGTGGFKWYCHFDPSRGVFEEVPKDRALDLVDLDRTREDDESNNVKKKLPKNVTPITNARNGAPAKRLLRKAN